MISFPYVFGMKDASKMFSFDEDGNFIFPEELIITANVKELPSGGFSVNESVKRIVFEEGSLETSGTSSIKIYNCPELTSVDVSKISNDISADIKGCAKFGQLIFDEDTKISGAVFTGCRGFSKDFVNDIISHRNYEPTIEFNDCSIWGESTADRIYVNEKCKFPNCSNIARAEYIQGCETVPINAFVSNMHLKEVILPDSITRINADAFRNCTELSVINFPDNLETVKQQAFMSTKVSGVLSCRALKYIEDDAFYGCGLTELNLPSATSIGARAFNVNKLTSVKLCEDKGVTIGEEAFKNQKNLTDVTGQLSIIGNSAFENCANLKDIDFSYAISIGDRAFYGCSALTNADITWTNGCEIGANAFENCTSLQTVRVETPAPSANAFMNCTALEYAEVNSVNKFAAGLFRGCSALKTFKIGKIPTDTSTTYYTSTGNTHILYDCTSLKRVIIPDGWDKNLLLGSGNNTHFSDNLLVDDAENPEGTLIDIISKLKVFTSGTHTLTIGTLNLAKLTREYPDIVAETKANKFWTIKA